FSGPISLARYMQEALVHPQHGYYVAEGEEAFGTKGDFVTSPDISQMFGELLGIWMVTQWEAQGRPGKICLMELGPGRASLLQDILRTIKQFPPIADSLHEIHLLEASSKMREAQVQRLCVPEDIEKDQDGKLVGATLLSTYSSHPVRVRWFDRMEDLTTAHTADTIAPSSKPWPILFAHEFFDALPTHRFRNTDKGWREIMVDIDLSPTSHRHFRMVLAAKETPASIGVFSHQGMAEKFSRIPQGHEVEVSLEARKVAEQVGQVVQADGAAMIIDYGKDHPQAETLRGIRDHQFVDILMDPGKADLSVDVDFSLLRDAIHSHANTHGPISQRHLLHSLGIQTRLSMLLRSNPSTRHKDMIAGYKRLTEHGAMGQIYQALSVTGT
ncbi:S-adenosyl-L-methionine-dependent methyltransferase, partial [Piptocephalis cylindrospora]